MAQTIEADWSGPYAGLSVGANSGDQDYTDGDAHYDLKGTFYSAFGGYNWTNGAMVYGGELSYSGGSAYEQDAMGSYEEFNYGRVVDLKARLGYSLDNVLLYGTVGYSMADFTFAGKSGDQHFDADGFIVSVGADYRIADRYFVGAEIVRRELRSDFPTEGSINTLSVRGGITF